MIEDFENQSSFMAITKIGNFEQGKSLNTEFNANDLPVLPTRNLILFPEVTAPIGMARETSRILADEASRRNMLVGVICQKDPEVDNPGLKDLEKYGVVARIINVITLPNGTHTAIIQAMGKFRVISNGEGKLLPQAPLSVSVKMIKDILPKKSDEEFLAMLNGIRESALKIIEKSSDGFGFELGVNLRNIEDPELLINTIATMFPFEHEVKIKFLALHRIKERAFEILSQLTRHEQMLELTETIRNKARKGMEEHQRNAFLHEQMEAIREELFGEDNDDIVALEERGKLLNLSDKNRQIFDKEVDKLRRLNPQSPDYSVQFNYLDLVASLPWNVYKEPKTDINQAELLLEESQYGMDKVKERILEQLAVIINNPDVKSPIICLVGPPGVGKTSIARFIANALGREYQRISLGGVHDEAEIRGHRRTYIGAMPGRIIDAMKKVHSSNPVIVLDEIDKLGQDYKGDPSSALLEVLDPEQNCNFHDNYVDMDFDLSKVMFIATANSIANMPKPLLDRMEIIEVSGYALEEKIEIAKRFLIDKAKLQLGYIDKNLKFTDGAIAAIIDEYTAESGVRQLQKNIDSIIRKIVRKELKKEEVKFPIDENIVRNYLGISHLGSAKYENNDFAGIVTGLAWTAAGGEILFIESSLIPGKGEKLSITGNLGDVMKESATLALQYVKANSEKFGIDRKVFEENNIHIHVPEGAVPKDGPSAGITIVTSLVSAIKNLKVKKNLAMTGEITLRGKVLPVGGIKEKILAAKRAGIKEIILSEENRKDIKEIEKYIEGLSIHFVKNLDEVLNIALTDEKAD